MGFFDSIPLDCINPPCMSPQGNAAPDEIQQMWIVSIAIWSLLVISAYFLVSKSKEDLKDWVMAVPYFSGFIGIGTIGISVLLGGFMIPEGEVGRWTESFSQYGSLGVMVYYQPMGTIIPLGFTLVSFGALVTLAEGWRRWWGGKSDVNNFGYTLFALFSAVVISLLTIPVLGIFEPPSSLGFLGIWGVTFLVLLLCFAVIASINEGIRRGEVWDHFLSLFLLSTWAGLVMIGTFWVEVSLAFSRHFDGDIHTNASFAALLFSSLTPFFGSITVFYLATREGSERGFESRLLLISTAILILGASYLGAYEFEPYPEDYSRPLLSFHEHILLATQFLWLSYFGTEMVDD